MSLPVLALDVGGTKLAAAVVAPDGSLCSRAEVPTPFGDAFDVWDALVSTATEALGSHRVQGVGIGCGGPLELADGLVSPLNLPAWQGFPLRESAEAQWPDLPVALHNDAVAFALGEQRNGAAAGWRNVLGVVVSTGVGGGLILDGAVRDGPHGNAGHVGHLVVEPDGPACGCGGFGCVEAIARGPAIAGWAAPQLPAPLTARELATAGGPVAEAAFARAGRAVALGLAGASALLDLDGIVVGGGVSRAGDLFWRPLLDTWATHARLTFTRDLPVVPAALGADAGLVGAAALLG